MQHPPPLAFRVGVIHVVLPPHPPPWECLRFLQLQHLQGITERRFGREGEGGSTEDSGEEKIRQRNKRSSLGRSAEKKRKKKKRERKEKGEEIERNNKFF